MNFADKKIRNLRLRHLNQQRPGRIRKLMESGLIKSEEDVPEHAIPMDPDRSTKMTLILPPPYYEDIDYNCVDCGQQATWRAEAQQYYFEVLRESPHQQAVRCHRCQAARKRAVNQDRES